METYYVSKLECRRIRKERRQVFENDIESIEWE